MTYLHVSELACLKVSVSKSLCVSESRCLRVSVSQSLCFTATDVAKPSFTFWKSHFSQYSHFGNLIFCKNSHFWNRIFHNIHILEISFFAKNSHFENRIFHKYSHFGNLIFGNLIFRKKITLWKSHFSQYSHFGNHIFRKNSHFGNRIFHKYSNFGNLIFRKKSLFGNRIFHEIHILEITFFTFQMQQKHLPWQIHVQSGHWIWDWSGSGFHHNCVGFGLLQKIEAFASVSSIFGAKIQITVLQFDFSL